MKIINTNRSEVSHHETLSNGHTVPVYMPVFYSTKLKARKYTSVVERYSTIKQIYPVISNGCDIISIGSVKSRSNEEEELVALTNKVLQVSSKKDGKLYECLIPNACISNFKQISFKHMQLPNRKFFKSLYDCNGILLISFAYNVANVDITKTAVTNVPFSKVKMSFHFSFVYINAYDHVMKTYQKTLSVFYGADDLVVDFMLKKSVLNIIWTSEKHIAKINFSENNINAVMSILPQQISIMNKIKFESNFFSITERDDDFTDSVFSVTDISKRKTTFYNTRDTSYEKPVSSRTMLQEISEHFYLDYASDVIYADIPCKPLWIVAEWLLPAMTLRTLLFYHEKNKKIETMDFPDLFTEYKTYFKTPNESQMSGFEICPLTWTLFVWSSKQHLLVIDLLTLQITCILKLNTARFFDFKNHFYSFVIGLSRCGRDVTVFIKKGKNFVHFEHFVLPHRLSSLKLLSKVAVVNSIASGYVLTLQNIEASMKEALLSAY